jgi:hypothetical protein
MLRKANNVFSVILSDVTQLSAGLPALGTVVTDANLAIGAVVLTDVGLRRINLLSGLADGEQFFIVQGKGVGNPLMKTPVLTKGKVKISIAKFRPAVQQITVIGYNGTTGALPVANNTDFWIKVRKHDNDAANRSQPMSLFAGPVKTDATGTQEELALLLAKNGIKNFSQEPANGYLRFENITSATDAAITGTVANFGVAYNSYSVTLDGTVTNVSVGDWIKLGGTSTTTAVYKVVAVNSPNSITLDTPYQGATATIAVANVRRITAANAATANFGVRLTGVPAPFDVNAFRDYYANRFTATFSDPTTLVTHVQGARNGNGMWQQVAMDEYMSYGYEGQNDMLAVPPRFRDQEVKIPGTAGNTALTTKYSAITLAWEEGISGLVSMAGGKGSAILWLNLADNAGSGSITSTVNTGQTLATALGVTASDLNE